MSAAPASTHLTAPTGGPGTAPASTGTAGYKRRSRYGTSQHRYSRIQKDVLELHQPAQVQQDTTGDPVTAPTSTGTTGYNRMPGNSTSRHRYSRI